MKDWRFLLNGVLEKGYYSIFNILIKNLDEVCIRYRKEIWILSGLYYMHREYSDKMNLIVGSSFWKSFQMYILRISENHLLAEHFGLEHFDDVYSVDKDILIKRMTEELGCCIPLVDENFTPETNEILSIVEFIYRFISKPTEQVYDSYNYIWIPRNFTKQEARYEYTVYINNLLKKNKHPFRIKKGVIEKVHSLFIDSSIDNNTVTNNDEHLKKLLINAIHLFREPSGNKKIEALNAIANILERLKTYESMNKKKSIEDTISKITADASLQSLINNHINSITKISNQCTIRHQEVDRIVLKDERLIEFLFYSYYNLIRLILDVYNSDLNI